MTKKKKPEELKKMGRPTMYTPELADEICDAIATSELGLMHLVNQHPNWPERQVIFLWRRKYPDFDDKYMRAKEQQADVVFEYTQEVMSEPHKWEDPETGIVKIDVPMLRLKMDTMKWHAAKLKPKKFGEAKDVEPPNNDLNDDCKKRYADLEKSKRKEF